MKKILLIITVSLFAFGVSYAGSNIGCGLGTTLIGEKDSILAQVVAATVNGTSGNQTFGISSGTLGCRQPSKVLLSERVNKFVKDNMDNLALDISKGQGETLTNLAILMNVSDVNTFGKKLQSNFDTIYASADVEYADVVDAIYASI